MLTSLTQSRKKRPVPSGWATPDMVASFAKLSQRTVADAEAATTLAVDVGLAALGCLSGIRCCALPPDGHIIAVGTTSGQIKLYMTKTLQEAAVFAVGSLVAALTFSENGFWFAAAAADQASGVIFGIRKDSTSDAARAK